MVDVLERPTLTTADVVYAVAACPRPTGETVRYAACASGRPCGRSFHDWRVAAGFQ